MAEIIVRDIPSIDSYDEDIEKNAKKYGYKAANLINLANLVKGFKETLEYKTLVELYGEIEIDVPSFEPIEADVIHQHLDQYAPEWGDLWQDFEDAFNSQKDQNILGEASIKCLEKLQQVIIDCFSKHLISPELYRKFVGDNKLQPDDLLMVRSSGLHEDKADMANPGGNESLPCRARSEEISKALGKVASSYVGAKSLSQRLINSQDSKLITEFPVMPGLVQRMVGEDINGKEIGEDDIIFSVVAHTDPEGGTRMQAAYGHGEYVVNSKGLVDNYYFSSEGIAYQEICPKDQRLRAEIIDQKVSLEWVKNSPELKYSSTIEAKKEGAFLSAFAQYGKQQYGHDLDFEWAGRRFKDTEGNQKTQLNIVQARIIPEGSRKGLIPSAMAPTFLAENSLKSIKGLQVITPLVNRAACVSNLNQIIIANTIGEALSRYNALGKNSGIKAVIVQEAAADTSHEAGVFNSSAIAVMQVKDISEVEKLLANNLLDPLIIDPQHDKIYRLPNKLLSANIEGDIEDALYESKILQNGIFASTLTSYVDIVPYDFSLVTGQVKEPLATDLALENKALSNLIAEAEAGNLESAGQLFFLAYQPMTYGKPAIHEQGESSEDKVKKLRDNIEALSNPKLGGDNNSVREAFSYVATVFNDAYKKKVITGGLIKQAVMAGANLQVLLDKMAQLTPANLSQAEQDRTYLEYFNVLKKFEGLITGEGDSLTTSLQANKYKELAEKLNSKITGDTKEILIDSLKLGDYLISKEEKEKWYKFGATVCVKEEFAQKLGYLIKELVSYKAHEPWINYIFTQVNEPKNPKPTLGKLTKDFANIDLEKIDQATTLIGRMEGQISQWSDPGKYDDLSKQLHKNLPEINQNLKWNAKANNLEKILISSQVHKLANDILDKSTKSLQHSSLYPEGLKDSKGNNLQVARFLEMVTQFHELMEIWVENSGFEGADYTRVQARLTAMQQFLQKKEQEKEKGTLTKAEFSPSPHFVVNRATLDIEGVLPQPETLEDFLTLCHQNILVALNHASKDINKIIEQQYPPLVQRLNDKFNNEIRGELNKEIHPSTTIDIKDGKLTISKNLPLRSHSATAKIKYIPKTDTISIQFFVFGEEEGDRMKNIELDLYLGLMKSNCKFRSKPYYNKQTGVLSCEVEIHNEEQVNALIAQVNDSIVTSFELAGPLGIIVPSAQNTAHIIKLVNTRLQMLEELSIQYPDLEQELNNLHFIPRLPISWAEFKDIQQSNLNTVPFLFKYIINIANLSEADLPPQKLFKMSIVNFKTTIILIENSSDILRLVQSGESIQKLIKMLDGDANSKEKAKFFINHSVFIARLVKAGLSYQKFSEIYDKNKEKAELVVTNNEAINYVINEIKLFTWEQVVDMTEEEAKLYLRYGKIIYQILPKFSIPSEKAIDLYYKHQEKAELLFEYGNQNVDSDMVFLLEIGWTPQTIMEIFDKDKIQAQLFLNNNYNILRLGKVKINVPKLREMYAKDKEMAEFFISRGRDIGNLLTIENGPTLQEFIDLYKNSIAQAEFLTNESRIIYWLSMYKMPYEKLLRIYNNDPNIAKLICKNYDQIVSILKSDQLAADDILKYNFKQITQLLEKKITPKQLKNEVNPIPEASQLIAIIDAPKNVRPITTTINIDIDLPALHKAIEQGNIEVADSLFKQLADKGISFADSSLSKIIEGKISTLLDIALESPHNTIKVIETLLSYPTGRSLVVEKDVDGFTPLENARRRGNMTLVAILEDAYIEVVKEQLVKYFQEQLENKESVNSTYTKAMISKVREILSPLSLKASKKDITQIAGLIVRQYVEIAGRKLAWPQKIKKIRDGIKNYFPNTYSAPQISKIKNILTDKKFIKSSKTLKDNRFEVDPKKISKTMVRSKQSITLVNNKEL